MLGHKWSCFSLHSFHSECLNRAIAEQGSRPACATQPPCLKVTFDFICLFVCYICILPFIWRPQTPACTHTCIICLYQQACFCFLLRKLPTHMTGNWHCFPSFLNYQITIYKLAWLLFLKAHNKAAGCSHLPCPFPSGMMITSAVSFLNRKAVTSTPQGAFKNINRAIVKFCHIPNLFWESWHSS